MAVSSGSATVTLPTDEQILITRELEAQRHLVFEAFTTPQLVRRWWHAKRGEMTTCEIDFRVGGAWRYEGAPEGSDGTVNRATFTETDGRTTLTILVQAPSREVRDAIVGSDVENGLQDALDLLEEAAGTLR